MSEVSGEAIIRKPLMSGHCASGGADLSRSGHERCQRNGGFQRANPAREFQPCPCACHYVEAEQYECGGCGHVIIATDWPLDADGDTRYAHIDHDGRVIGEDCTERPVVSRNPEPEPEPEVEDDTEWIAEQRAVAGHETGPLVVEAEPVEPDEEADNADEWDDMFAEFDLDDED